MIFCHDKREYMTLGEYMEKYPIAYAEAVESMTTEQKALFAARFEDRYIYLPKDETSDTGENFTISANVKFVTPNADNPESIPAGGTAYWKYTVDSDAEDPVIAVTGCEWVAPAEGMIFLFNPNGNITITVTASLKYYTITTNGENCSFTPSTGKIQARGSQQVFIHPATNYKWNGTLTVTGATAIKNVSGSYITLVNPTGDVTVSATCDRIVYPLTVSGINCTPNPKPTQIAAGGTLAITYTAAAGYDLPEASGVGVTGCSFGWNQSTGVLTLYNPTGAVAAGVVAVAKSYAITATVTNGTATGANVIHTGETVALTIAADEGYNLPDTVTVTGASQTWNKETGTLTLSNPTGAVTISAVCDEISIDYTDCLTFKGENSEFTLKATSHAWDGTVEWSTNHSTWTTLSGTEAMQSVGKKIYLRGKGNTTFNRSSETKWILSQKAGCTGNIQTLLDWKNPPTYIPSEYCFGQMFENCANLTKAPELTATTLKRYCYQWRFDGCSSLKVNDSSGNKIFHCPSNIPDYAVRGMFSNTGGSFTGTPIAGNTYYWTE